MARHPRISRSPVLPRPCPIPGLSKSRGLGSPRIAAIDVNPGHTFLDRMIQLVEAAKRQKTPNEIALTVLLSVLTLIFVIVVAAIAPVATYLEARINVADLVAFLVDDNRRAPFRYRNRRHRPDDALQRPGDVRQGGRSRW
jgi:hypothetical protein